jgi:hypothetical protein
MQNSGNTASNAKYEKCLPKSIGRPNEYSAPILLKHFIESKYSRLDFSVESQMPLYYKGLHSGSLEKRMKVEDKWITYYFSIKGDTLEYSTDENSNDSAISKVDLVNANVVVSPKVLSRAKRCSFVLTFNEDDDNKKFSSIFLAGDNGFQIWQWYCAIRASKLQAMIQKHPQIPVALLSSQLTHDFLMEGFLCKSDPREDPSNLQKRWCVLDDRHLYYYGQPLDPYPKGQIYLGHPGSVGQACQDRKDLGPTIFTLQNQNRKFFFKADLHIEKMEWLNLFRFVQEQPLTNLVDQARLHLKPSNDVSRSLTVIGRRNLRTTSPEATPSYHVSVRTAEDALTLTTIETAYMRICGQNWKSGKIRLPKQEKPDDTWAFKRNQTDVFQIEEDLGIPKDAEIESIEIWTDNKGEFHDQGDAKWIVSSGS